MTSTTFYPCQHAHLTRPSAVKVSVRAAAVTAVTLLTITLLGGCAVGPNYIRPQIDTPSAFKEDTAWKTATPQQIDANQQWWEMYGDSTLNALIIEANRANQNIRQAEAQYRLARATADVARSGFWPTAGVGIGAGRARTISSGVASQGNSYNASINASWEPDIWGGVRRAVESGEAGTQASAADLAAARLSIQATLAQDYLQLRITDQLKDLYARTDAAYTRSLKLTQSQYNAGVALRSDVAQAEAQLKTAQAQAIDLNAQRGQLEHAIAILTGKSPAAFSLPAIPSASLSPLVAHLPIVPPGLPSDLLERRPDIAAAERRAALANANIGVAKAAYFPVLMLNASGAFTAGSLATWFDTPGRVWSLGSALAQTLFDGGLRRAHSDQAIASYDSAVAQYKQTVLGGFQDVEDNLTTLHVLDQEGTVQDQAVAASQLSERLALSQYQAGTTTYLSVATAQTIALTNARTAVQIRGRQLVASVGLIKAIGGGWDVRALSKDAMNKDALNSPAIGPTAQNTQNKPVIQTNKTN
ncbi:efflux transporter outer membrane subunit [Glaciimonas sp. CA11.2]|uniref:efflux transporter outer membrane subunit n=1 Tax=Glaciimonas sp. CA11.2 TaxID=3048601 RepID=UPI002AB50293|nr:efflux transporter outer membrane subunit [Glaciimonas sp. CA11.2]MDY7547566.1 efflux transporter outer membrane subunit [Glaciimonas sp. CA11.2]MEB0162038.1 efflux transporter outer membrane subunit [Glaciimonas sp. CA11.2]